MPPTRPASILTFMSSSSDRFFYPSAATLRWVADALGAGAKIKRLRRLAGATSSVLHKIEADYKGRSVEFVLRQFFDAEWLKLEPDLARHEASNLERARAVELPTPELIAFDESGAACGGVPSTLTTFLPGSVELQPEDFAGWLRGLAEAALRVHSVEAEDYGWRFYHYTDVSSLEPPRWSSVPELWERAIETANGRWPDARACFIHRDYHPNNVLWQKGRVSGLVDWVNACRGVANFDVAWCRQNLVQLYGVEAADRFLADYGALAGARFDYHPFWDLLAATEFLPGPPGVYPGWLDFGIRHLDAKIILERADAYLVSIMARL